MEQFFEAWVETVMRCVARNVGGILKTGRQRETVAPPRMEPTIPWFTAITRPRHDPGVRPDLVHR